MNADAIIGVRFKTSEEGGRSTPITGDVYLCVLFIGDEGFDCRIKLENKSLELGMSYELPVCFLFKDIVMPKISPGVAISLWEGKEIARGTIKRHVQRSA